MGHTEVEEFDQGSTDLEFLIGMPKFIYKLKL